jgi:hypothetical protein
MNRIRKHKFKHDKPFMCDIPGCKRDGRGFTTVNDLDRHKKSVHRINLLRKSYQCASRNCRNREKIWPRLDNFKQHIDRMHKEEDDIDLIKRYAYARERWEHQLNISDLLSSPRSGIPTRKSSQLLPLIPWSSEWRSHFRGIVTTSLVQDLV